MFVASLIIWQINIHVIYFHFYMCFLSHFILYLMTMTAMVELMPTALLHTMFSPKLCHLETSRRIIIRTARKMVPQAPLLCFCNSMSEMNFLEEMKWHFWDKHPKSVLLLGKKKRAPSTNMYKIMWMRIKNIISAVF